jgi:hypothetical protein
LGAARPDQHIYQATPVAPTFATEHGVDLEQRIIGFIELNRRLSTR